MKSKNQFFIVAISAIFIFAFSSCMNHDDPMGCFTTSATTINAGETIDFDGSCSTDTHHWEWDFGDGATGEGESISHTYNNPGIYDVSLAVHNEDMSKMNEEMITITVN